jgi:hypothetical protein
VRSLLRGGSGAVVFGLVLGIFWLAFRLWQGASVGAAVVNGAVAFVIAAALDYAFIRLTKRLDQVP